MNDFRGFHPSNAAGYLRGRETLSERNISLLLSVLSINPETLKLAPSRVHIWIVALHEPETMTAAAEAFLEPPVSMTLDSPDPALLRSGNLRGVLLRKLFLAKMSETPLS